MDVVVAETNPILVNIYNWFPGTAKVSGGITDDLVSADRLVISHSSSGEARHVWEWELHMILNLTQLSYAPGTRNREI